MCQEGQRYASFQVHIYSVVVHSKSVDVGMMTSGSRSFSCLLIRLDSIFVSSRSFLRYVRIGRKILGTPKRREY